MLYAPLTEVTFTVNIYMSKCCVTSENTGKFERKFCAIRKFHKENIEEGNSQV